MLNNNEPLRAGVLICTEKTVQKYGFQESGREKRIRIYPVNQKMAVKLRNE